MPELPEVETVRRQLAPLVEGRRLERMEILDPRWSRPLAPAGSVARSRAKAKARSLAMPCSSNHVPRSSPPASTTRDAAPSPSRHDGPLADVGATVLRWLTGRDAERLPGQTFLT